MPFNLFSSLAFSLFRPLFSCVVIFILSFFFFLAYYFCLLFLFIHHWLKILSHLQKLHIYFAFWAGARRPQLSWNWKGRIITNSSPSCHETPTASLAVRDTSQDYKTLDAHNILVAKRQFRQNSSSESK